MSEAPEARAIAVGSRTAGIALGAIVVAVAVALGAAAEGWSTPGRLGETGLLGGAVIVYPSEDAARAACGADRVVYVLDDGRRYLERARWGYVEPGGPKFPLRGFACERDAAADRLVPGP